MRDTENARYGLGSHTKKNPQGEEGGDFQPFLLPAPDLDFPLSVSRNSGGGGGAFAVGKESKEFMLCGLKPFYQWKF